MVRHRQLKAQVESLLAGLGDSPATVAASLCQEGVWGIPNNPRCCAVSSYLGAVLGADPRVRSLTTGQSLVKIIVDGALQFLPPAVARVRLPPPVRQFIDGFDRGVYPMLVRVPVVEAQVSSESTSG
ncbi:MAG: hypothetical protein QOJ44_1472 [Acidimicrobiaceae bacterium]|jgi:hypothetical protein|nr:hypothetical protein [Acidimicrobiaceae bacterium]